MNEVIEKITFLEELIILFAESKIDDAYNMFKREYGYDLRDKKNNDHLKFDKWEIDNNELVLYYIEITPHDQPYGIDIRFDSIILTEIK